MELGQERVQAQANRITTTINNSHQVGMIQPFTYTGYQKDNVANTYYAQAREYVAEVGRFGEQDRAKYGLNWYIYCDNSPMMLVDLTGFIPTPLEAALMAQHVYNTKKPLEANGWEYEKMLVEEGILTMALYINTTNDVTEYAVVNKGSQTLGCWGDFIQPIGLSTAMRNSIAKAREFDEEHKDYEVTFIGHSKGGGEAAANGLATNRNTIVFQPSTTYTTRYGISTENYTANMDMYVIEGEVLDSTLKLLNVRGNTLGERIDLPNIYVSSEWKTQIYYSLLNHSMEHVIEVLEILDLNEGGDCIDE